MSVREVIAASVTILQEGNTMGTTSEFETLEIRLDYQLPEKGAGDDGFFVLKSTGWSIDGPDELAQVLLDFRLAIGNFSRGKV